MTITLPRLPRTAQYELRPVRTTRVQRAATGGALLPISRMGDHWEIEIDVGSLSAICARELMADLLRAGGQPVRVLIPQHGIDAGAPGGPVVSGGGQAGSSIELEGFTAHFAIRKGWYLTIETDGVGRAFLVCEEVVADADGLATVAIWPMLREPPADGDRIEIVEPWLEGLVDKGGETEGGLGRAVTPGAFVIEEAQ